MALATRQLLGALAAAVSLLGALVACTGSKRGASAQDSASPLSSTGASPLSSTGASPLSSTGVSPQQGAVSAQAAANEEPAVATGPAANTQLANNDAPQTPSPTSMSAGTPGQQAKPAKAGVLTDSFAGDGPLLGYVTNNPGALPDVKRVGGRYRANVASNRNDVTLHYNEAQGRLDAKLVAFPFEVIARNVGVGNQANSQKPAQPVRDTYIFAGIQIHDKDLNARESSHVVVGHRGMTYFTIEGKNTVAGRSRQNDAGANVVPLARADLRIVGNADHSLKVYWQRPNAAPGKKPDAWQLYKGNGVLPGPAPKFSDAVYVGLISYAYGYSGVPFVGTCDALEGGGS